MERINGANFVSPVNRVEHDCIAPLKRINANWVALTPFAFMTPGNPAVEYNCEKNWWGDTPAGIKHLAASARKQNMKICLKPHFWVANQGWPGDYDLSSEGWEAWERNYESFMLQLARICESLDIEMLCIGTEFKIAVRKRKQFWSTLIEKIRRIYSGKLVYAANWDNYANVSFWDKLDYIGIDAYHPLSGAQTPSVEALKKAWKTHLPGLKYTSKSYGKPILFTEFGYRSIDKAAWQQWEIEGLPSNQGINHNAQVNGYQAIFEVFWDEPWFAGGFLWKWWDHDQTAGGKGHSNYTPQNKPAEKVIKEWYARST